MGERVVWRVLLSIWLLGWAYFGFPKDQVTAARLDRVEWVPELHKPRDMVLNFVYYVFFGVLLSRLGVRPWVAVAAAAGFSALTEISQIFSLSRYPSATDLVVNIAGAVTGVVALAGSSWFKGSTVQGFKGSRFR